jgi:hypothetical protein
MTLLVFPVAAHRTTSNSRAVKGEDSSAMVILGEGMHSECVQQKSRLLRTRPDKALAYMFDAIEQLCHGLLSREYSACPAAKRVDNGLMRRLIQRTTIKTLG